MKCGEHVGQPCQAGRMGSFAITEQRMNVRLIEHRPMLDAVGQPPRHDPRILGKLVRYIAIEPAAFILQRLGQIPVKETQPRRNSGGDQAVDQPIVKIETARLDGALAGWLDTRPRG